MRRTAIVNLPIHPCRPARTSELSLNQFHGRATLARGRANSPILSEFSCRRRRPRQVKGSATCDMTHELPTESMSIRRTAGNSMAQLVEPV